MRLGCSSEHIPGIGFYMGRRKPCNFSAEGLRRGAWTAEEDMILNAYIKTYGEGRWRSLPKKAGLERCGKSCRLRWLNYLRPDIKRGNITLEEEDLIIRLHKLIGNRWSLIAGRIPGRTDNEIKNYWNTYLKKKVENRDARSTSARAKPVCSTVMISNFVGENSESKLVKKGQLAKPEKAQESAPTCEPSPTPQEESWWDLLMSLDAGNDSAAQISSLNFMSLCGDESPGNNYLEEMMICSAREKLDFELEAVANFFSYEED